MTAAAQKRASFGLVEAEVTHAGALVLRRGGVICGFWEEPEALGRARPIDADEQAAMRWGWGMLRDRATAATATRPAVAPVTRGGGAW